MALSCDLSLLFQGSYKCRLFCLGVLVDTSFFNPLMGTGNYSATSNNMKLAHWPLMGGCYIWYSEEGTGRGRSPSRSLLAVPNVTAHPSTASVPITVLLYSGSLLCGFNVPVKGLTDACSVHMFSFFSVSQISI